jgi:folate-dependent phosphoribosylglycinamide formyltransferase PurN
MSIVFLTGSHPRHAFLAHCIAQSGHLSGLVIEEREAHLPSPPDGLSDQTRALFIEHFKGRGESERRFLPGEPEVLAGIPTLRVTRDELNSQPVWAFLAEHGPRILFSYGVHMLSPETLSHAPGHRWNIHGGLSPWYRGSITHFWPSYLLEPQMTGMTVHALTEAIDAGDIVHQAVAPLSRGDGLHDLACRAVAALGEELPRLIELVLDGKVRPLEKQRTTGRIWRSADWRPEHLHLIYELYENRIVDHYLDGAFRRREPKLVRQF